MMYATFNGNTCTTINFSATSDETDITFYNELFSLVQHFLNHNILIISGGNDRNYEFF